MKMYIYSTFGVLDCQPMTLQAIENSIPVGTNATEQEETEVAPDTQVSDGQTDESN